MSYVYILILVDNSYYVGCTSNLEKRMSYHIKGKVFSTRNKRPLNLCYFEKKNDLGEARRRELQIKGWKSRKAIERLIKKFKILK